ncbi:MAG: UDP-N-acetylmuramate dehydrogenase [Planctomycetaceae bacterium]|nr:UDP-N-acetylmuramate dehydrogenase [Planctomycetaceae bacterium]
MNFPDEFHDITRRDVPLAPYTWLKVGGPAQYLVEPRSVDELAQVVRSAHQAGIPFRMLGGGSNVLIPDAGLSGITLRLSHEAFATVVVTSPIVRAGAGALLSHARSESVAAGLAGMENLVGIPGTVGGALRGNAGSRHGEVGQYVKSVTVLTAAGELCVRTEDELTFAYRSSSINEPAIVDVEFELTPDDPDEISRRMRKLWVMKKATQPLSFQSAGCVFKNPRGLSAGALIEQAGLKGTRVGQAEVSDRHANFVITHEGATAADVRTLIDLIRSKVSEIHGVDLEQELQAW